MCLDSSASGRAHLQLQRAAFEAAVCLELSLLEHFQGGAAQEGAEAILHLDDLVVERAGLFIAAPVGAEGAHDGVACLFKLIDDLV